MLDGVNLKELLPNFHFSNSGAIGSSLTGFRSGCHGVHVNNSKISILLEIKFIRGTVRYKYNATIFVSSSGSSVKYKYKGANMHTLCSRIRKSMSALEVMSL